MAATDRNQPLSVEKPNQSKMRSFLFITLLSFSALCVAEDDCPLRGEWKSDAARTLADIASRDTFDGEARNAASQDLFGHLIHQWTCSEFKAYRGDSEPAEALTYQIRNRDAVSFTVIFSDQRVSEMEIILEGECYKVLIPGRQFYEYFCPILTTR